MLPVGLLCAFFLAACGGGGGPSGPAVPKLISLSPSSVPEGSPLQAVTITGSGFTPTALVRLGGFSVQTTYVSSTTLVANDLSFSGSAATTYSFTVADPASGNVPSNALLLTLTPAIPITLSLEPASVIAYQGAVSVVVMGENYTPTSIVYFNGTARPTTTNNFGQLVAQLTAADVSTAGTYSITVEDVASKDVPSNAQSFLVEPLPPLGLANIYPSTVPAGNATFTLGLVGTGFAAGSTVTWNGVSLSTAHVSDTELTAVVSSSLVSTVGTASIEIANPAGEGGTSSPLSLSIVSPSIDAVSYQIDQGHSGAVNFQSVSLPTTGAWTVDVGGTPSYALIVNKIVYVMADNDGNSQLFALNAATGATIWGPIAFSGAGGITYDAGLIFVNSGPYTSTGVISALDAATGATKWSATIPGTFATQSPAVAWEGIVYMLDDGVVTAFDETTGAQLWQAGFTGTYGSIALTVDGVFVSQPCMSGALRPMDGATIWGINTGCDGGGGETPVVAQGQFYSPMQGGIFGGTDYSTSDGTVLGTFNFSAPVAITAGGIYSLTGSTLQGQSLTTHTVAWSFAGDGALVTAPIVVNNYVFVGSSNGNLYAVDAATGVQLWTTNLGAPIPQVSSGGYAFDNETGLSAGDGLLVVPAGDTITAFVLSANP
jgi:outer membrane protein assembly factor BamB